MKGRMEPWRPTAQEIQAFLDRHGLTQVEVAHRAGIGRRTLARYLKEGTTDAHPPTLRMLTEFMVRVDRRADH